MPATAAEVGGRSEPGRSEISSALRRFALWSLLALVVVGLGTVWAGFGVSRSASLEIERAQTQRFATEVAAPLVTSQLRAHDAEATQRLALVMHGRLGDGSMSHIKIWSEDGTIIWSD